MRRRGCASTFRYATIGDLARFAHALLRHKLLGAGSTRRLLAGKIEISTGSGLKYAYGFFDARRATGDGWVGHGGGAPGMNGDLRIYPKSGHVVAVLTNLDPPTADQVTEYLDPRLSPER